MASHRSDRQSGLSLPFWAVAGYHEAMGSTGAERAQSRDAKPDVTVALAWSRRSPEVRIRVPVAQFDRWMAVAEAYDLAPFPLLTTSCEDRVRPSQFAALRSNLDKLCQLLNDPPLHEFARQVCALLDELAGQHHDRDAQLLFSWGEPVNWQ